MSSRWLIGSVLALAAWGACASGGRIVFSGAVVAPTCAVDTAAGIAPGTPAVAHGTCGQTATAAGSHFTSRAVTLNAATVADDHLLAYFVANQLAAASDQAAKLVVRTYE